MRAVMCREYGVAELLQVEEVAVPSVADDELLVEVHASAVNRSDAGFRSGRPWIARWFTGLRRPSRQIVGTEFSGVVAQAGVAVTGFRVGDRVFGVQAQRFGANAEYLAIRATAPVAVMPSTMSFIEAAGICDGMSLALGCLRRAGVTSGQRVAVYGASGSIGSAGVQLAKWMGAHVTAICREEHFDLVRRLGADEVIDYRVADFTKGVVPFDVVFDAVGKLSYFRCRRILRVPGVYASTDLGFMWMNPVLMFATRLLRVRKSALLPLPPYTQANIELLADLWNAGRYVAVIDRTCPLDDVVAATKYVESGQKVGNVVLVVR
jgi:NADPH:quinone reductase-like Zn-dependent oxidoreductase